MKSVSATNARRQLFDLIEQAGKPGSVISITHRDLPGVIMMSYDEFEGWVETMEILSDPKLMKDIQEGVKDAKSVSWQDAKKKLGL